MKQYISEGRAMYEDENHGLFSKKLAEFAIGNMVIKEETAKAEKALKPHTIDEMQDVLELNDVQIPTEFIYTAWYLFNMTYADYPKTITTDKQRATYIEETLCDPDGCPENVLDCFVTKMKNACIPIYWEMML